MRLSLAALAVLAIGISPEGTAQNVGSFKAGAAKIDVTPAPNELTKSYEGILDHLYSRAIVLDNGAAIAALISVDAGGIPDPIWRGVTEQVEKDLGIPAKNVLITATHTPAPQVSRALLMCRKSWNL